LNLKATSVTKNSIELDSTQLQLIQKSFVSALSEEERTALNDCLRNSEAARSYYRRAAKLDTLLKETSLTVLENSTTSNMTPFIMWKIAALFFMTLSLILFLQLKLSFDNSNSLETTSYVPKSLALIRHAVNLNTQDSLALENTKTLSSGIVSIAQGLVQLDFISGVTIIAEGPFKLDLISDMQITCTQGKIRVLIPPQAKAFKLATPDLDFLTSGSEFGVSVTKEGSAIDIIDGLLEIQHHHATLTTLKKDDQVLITNGLLTASHAPFSTPSPQDLSLALEQSIQNHQQKWLDSLLTILQDQELSLYYDFHKNDAWGKTLRNLIASPQSLTYGAIIGAQWAQGRMGQDTALEFKGNDHFVRLEDQTHYQSITLLTWIWIDTLDASFTTLLSSDYWKEKGVHWHISKKGVLTLGVYPPKGKNAIFVRLKVS